MFQCLYCPTTFAAAPKEHILQNFLGARWESPEIICASCQKEFGEGIDKALEAGLKPIRNLMGTEGGRGGKGPTLEGLTTSSAEVIDLLPGGQPRLKQPDIRVTPRGDNRHDVRVNLGHRNHLGWAVKKLKELFPEMSFDAAALMLLMRPVQALPGGLELGVVLGGADYFRGLLKACFNLVGVTYPDAAQHGCFDALREFVRYGLGDSKQFVRWTTDAKPLLLSANGPIDHVIALRTRGEAVEGVVQLFGHIVHSVRLTAAYDGSPISCSYTVDPTRQADPAEERHGVDEQRIPLFDAQAREYGPAVQAAFQERLGRVVEHYQHTARIATAGKALQDFAGEYNNQPFTEKLAAVLADRLGKVYG